VSATSAVSLKSVGTRILVIFGAMSAFLGLGAVAGAATLQSRGCARHRTREVCISSS